MPGEPRIRERVSVVLNRLVSEGIITGFKTDFRVNNGPGAPHVAVIAPEGRALDNVQARVMDALADVAIGLNVTVEQG